MANTRILDPLLPCFQIYIYVFDHGFVWCKCFGSNCSVQYSLAIVNCKDAVQLRAVAKLIDDMAALEPNHSQSASNRAEHVPATAQDSFTDGSSEADGGSYHEKAEESQATSRSEYNNLLHPLRSSRSQRDSRSLQRSGSLSREPTTERSLHAVDDDALAEERRDLERTESQLKGEPISSEDEFLVVFESEDDPLNPRSLPLWRKWACVLTLALGAIAVYV